MSHVSFPLNCRCSSILLLQFSASSLFVAAYLVADTIACNGCCKPTPQVLPLENVRGRELVEAGKLCERKNGRGVDTNRNWEVDWGKKERDYDPAEEYPGTAPFSEPEVQIVLDVAKGLQPHVWLNVHSGMDAMFTPWDHKAEVSNGWPWGWAARPPRLLLCDPCAGWWHN